MVYSPTTWNTNDVITKDKLNKIEQGVKTATLLSGTDIDVDKDWQGRAVSNVKSLETGTLDGIIPVPPAPSRLISNLQIDITPVEIANLPGPYPHPGHQSGEWQVAAFTVPTDLTARGISMLHGLVKVTISYHMFTRTWYSSSYVYVNGVRCDLLTLSKPGGSGTPDDFDVTRTIYVSRGANIVFRTYNGSNDLPTPIISNIVIKLEGGYPFGDILATNYPTIAKASGAMLTPYHFVAHPEIECTCDFDGALATMGDYKARPFFPQQPGKVTLAWKPGSTWTATAPVMKFYRSRL